MNSYSQDRYDDKIDNMYEAEGNCPSPRDRYDRCEIEDKRNTARLEAYRLRRAIADRFLRAWGRMGMWKSRHGVQGNEW